MQKAPGESQRFVCSLRPLQGCGYGLRQKVMVGTIRVDPALSSRLDEMMLAAQELCSGSSFYSPDWENPSRSRAVEKAIFLYFLLQQCVKIPVFEEYRLSPETAHSKADRAGVSAISSCRLVLPYWTVNASRAVLTWMFAAVTRVHGRPDVGDLLTRIGPMGLHGTNAYPFLRAGWQQGVHRSEVSGRIIQFGLGTQSRWLDSTLTDRTPTISTLLVRNKQATNQLLARLGFPVPRQVVVTGLQQALEAAAQLGMPVVIKPCDQDQGRGVSVGLAGHDEVREAFDLASAYGPAVIVEQHCEGLDYRLTVFEGALVKVLKRTPLAVIGDGRSSIEALLRREEEAAKQRQGLMPRSHNPYAMDGEILRTLRRQGFADPTDVPPEHQVVPLRQKANLSAGGSQALVPISCVHPDNVRLAVSLATLLRLDCCGIDLLIPDISHSWLQVGCHVIELNAQPQLGVSHAPELYGEILQQMLSGSAPSVQLILDLSSSDPRPSISLGDPIVQQLHVQCPSPVLVATSTQLWKDQQLIQASSHAQWGMIEAALLDPTARSLILIMSFAECLHLGLPTHRIDKILCIHGDGDPAERRRRLQLIRDLAPDLPLVVSPQGAPPI